jgi:hypothetical protein
VNTEPVGLFVTRPCGGDGHDSVISLAVRLIGEVSMRIGAGVPTEAYCAPRIGRRLGVSNREWKPATPPLAA